jgi:hypothetical protein
MPSSLILPHGRFRVNHADDYVPGIRSSDGEAAVERAWQARIGGAA